MKNIMGMNIECDQILEFENTTQALSAMTILMNQGIESCLLSRHGSNFMNCVRIVAIR